MINQPIYLDNNATTPVDPRVARAVVSALEKAIGNPASTTHAQGWYAAELVQIAREHIAKLINAAPEEIVFTSGGTESNNLAIFGSLSSDTTAHAITSVIEHKSVLDPLRHLANQNRIALDELPVGQDGSLSTGALTRLLRPETRFVSLMLGNNEVGVINDIPVLRAQIQDSSTVFHCDATQALGRVPVDVQQLNIDLLTLSAHKVYGPKGVGVLYVRKGTKLTPLLYGGGHEAGLRSGTLNVPGIVGFGEAARLAKVEYLARAPELSIRANKLCDEIKSRCRMLLNGPEALRLPGQLSLRFPGVDHATLLGKISSRVSVSLSSACTSASRQPSFVLAALGLSEEEQRSSIRVGVGLFNTDAEIERAAEIIGSAVAELQRGS